MRWEYLENYPDTLNKTEIVREIGNLRRTDFSEWSIYQSSTVKNPSIHQIEFDPAIWRPERLRK